MKAAIRKHSWWVWLLVIVTAWAVLAVGAPKIDRIYWQTSPVASAR